MLQVIAGLDGEKTERGQRVLGGRESGGGGLAGSGSSHWSEAGSAGGKRELHSRRNNMAQSQTTHLLSFTLIRDDFTRHFITRLLLITYMRKTRTTDEIMNFTIYEK